MERYKEYKPSNIPWLEQLPSHWDTMRAKNLFKKEQRPVIEGDDIVTCFRDGEVTLRKNRRTSGFTEATDYSHYQHICKGDLVIHQMDAFAGSSGVSDSDGMGTPVLSVCSSKTTKTNNFYYAHILRLMGWNGFILSLYRGIRERSSDFRFDTFASLWLPLPPINEQIAIVKFLDNKCSKLDLLLEQKAKGITLCKEAIESLIYNQISNIQSWEECFPKDWKLITGRGLFEEIRTKGTEEDRFMAVTQDNGLIYKDGDDVNFVTAASKETQKLVCEGQFVISLRSFEGGIEYSDKRGLISPAYVVFRLKQEYDTPIMRNYYRFLFKSKPFVRRLNTISDSMRDGKSIKFNDIRNFYFPIPSVKELNLINIYSSVYDRMKATFDEEKTYIKEYKQRLISDVVTGQIKVC